MSWTDKWIARGRRELTGGVISTDKPEFKDVERSGQFQLVDENEFDRVCSFINDVCLKENRNTVLLSEKHRVFTDFSVAQMMVKGDRIMGVIFSHPLDLHLESVGGVVSHGYTTYLTVHPSLRKMSLAMSLIQRTMEIGHSIGTNCGYHLSPVRKTSNSIMIRQYIFPIMFPESAEDGFPFAEPSFRASKFERIFIKRRLRMVKYEDEMFEKVHSFVSRYTADHKIVFVPSVSTMKLLTKFMDGVVIIQDDAVVGFFFVHVKHVRNPKVDHTITVGDISYPIGCAVSIVCCIYKYLEELQINTAYVYEMGCMSHNLLTFMGFKETDANEFVNFYNNAEDVSSATKVSFPIY